MVIDPKEITHKDALTQVCPMSMNREEGSWMCQGQECMAWRWKDTKYRSDNYNTGFCGMVHRGSK